MQTWSPQDFARAAWVRAGADARPCDIVDYLLPLTKLALCTGFVLPGAGPRGAVLLGAQGTAEGVAWAAGRKHLGLLTVSHNVG